MPVTRRLGVVPDAPKRAGLYVRVSALMGRSGDAFHSPDLQLEAMRRYIASRGMVEVFVWTDLDRSGRTFEREGINAAFDAARSGAVDVIVVLDLSRLGRNTGESLRHIKELRSIGVDIVSTVEQIDDTPEGQFMLGQFLGMAQLYSDQMGRRWESVIAHNALQGVWHGRPPRGYTRTAKRVIEPHPTEGPVWQEAFERFAAGETVRAVALFVTEHIGRPLPQNELTKAFRSRAYLGEVRLGDRWYPGRHEPLVSLDLWQTVQDRLAENATYASRTKGVAHSLAGLLKCSQCGGALHKRPAPKDGRHNRTQVYCVARFVNPMACSGIGWPNLDKIEQAVLAELTRKVAQYADTSAAAAAIEDARLARHSADSSSVQAEITSTERAIRNAATKVAQGVLSDHAYRMATDALEDSLARLKTQARHLRMSDALPPFAEAASAATTLLALWTEMTNAERNAALKTHIQAVHVLPPDRPGSQAIRQMRIDWLR